MSGQRMKRWGGWVATLAAVLVLGLLCRESSADVRAHAGAPLMREGSWMQLEATVTNDEQQTLNGTLTVADSNYPDVHFSASVWVPPQARYTFPVAYLRRPTDVKHAVTSLNVYLEETSKSGGTPNILYKGENSSSVKNEDGDFPSAIFLSADDDDAVNAVTRMRKDHGHLGYLGYYDRRSGPRSVMGLLNYTEMVFCSSDSITPAQARAIREWVAMGGHLWIMAERVKPETARMILGPDWKCEATGVTELPTVRVENVDATAEKNADLSFEEPIRMVRMTSPGMEVTHRIKGWPAMMWCNSGRGQVLVTTFDLSSMIDPEGPRAKELPAWAQMIEERFLAGPRAFPPGQVIMPEGTPHPQAAMHELAASYVGHEVVGKMPVLSILGGMSLVLLVAGVQLRSKRRLELLAPTALALSLLATVAMVLLGAKSKGTTPLTIATMTEARMIPASAGLNYAGAVDVYSPTAFDGAIIGPRGGWILPELQMQKGHVVRMTWTEFAPMRWDYLHFPSATLRFDVAGCIELSESPDITATFGPQGIIMPASSRLLANGQDTQIVAPRGRLAPQKSADKLIAGEADQLPANVWAGRGAMNSERQHRLDAMKPSVQAAPRESVTLFTWDKTMDPGVEIAGKDAEKQTLTLVSAPVRLVRPATGTIEIPSALLKLSNVRIPGKTSALFDESTGKFPGEKNEPGKARNVQGAGGTSLIRFTVPAELLPMKLEKAELLVDVHAPDRSLKVFGLSPGSLDVDHPEVLATKENPSEPFAVPVENIQLDARGSMILGVKVSEGAPESTWEYKGLSLKITGLMEAKAHPEATDKAP